MRKYAFILFVTFPALGLAQGVQIGAGALSSIFSSKLAFQGAVNSTAPLSVAQLADGGGWTTQIQVLNLDTGPVNYSFQFWADDGSQLQLPFVNGTPGSFSGTLGVGGTAFAQTPGVATTTSQGWAQATSNGRIGILTIFRLTLPGQVSEGTVSGIQSGSHVFLPFDTTNGFDTGVAIGNSSASPLTVTLLFHPDSGGTPQASLSLPPHGHAAFSLAHPPGSISLPSLGGLRGSIELQAPTPDMSIVGLRFSPAGTFTSLGAFQ